MKPRVILQPTQKQTIAENLYIQIILVFSPRKQITNYTSARKTANAVRKDTYQSVFVKKKNHEVKSLRIVIIFSTKR